MDDEFRRISAAMDARIIRKLLREDWKFRLVVATICLNVFWIIFIVVWLTR